MVNASAPNHRNGQAPFHPAAPAEAIFDEYEQVCHQRIYRKHVDGQFSAECRQHHESRDYSGQEECLQLATALFFVGEGSDQGSCEQQAPWGDAVPYCYEIVIYRSFVMERVHRPPECLVEQEVAQVGFSSVGVNPCEPQQTQPCDYSPGLPA